MFGRVLKSCFSTAPNVWVNKHTKVICQGITGNQVPPLTLRAPSKPSRHSTTTQKWSEESTPKRQVLLTSVFPSLRTVDRLKQPLVVRLRSSTSLPQELLTPSSRHWRQNSTYV